MTSRMIAAVATLLAAVALWPTVVSADDTREEPKPLYLHWFAPEDGTPAALIASIRVTPSTPFDVVVADPTRPHRKFTIRGRVDRKADRYEADVDVRFVCGEQFLGPIELEKPRGGRLSSFAGVVLSTRLVLSHRAKADRFLASERNDEPDLVADVRVEEVTRWMTRGGEAIEIGTEWYVAKVRVLDVIAGDAAKKEDVVQIVLLDDANVATVLGFRNDRRQPHGIFERLGKPKSNVDLRVRLLQDPVRGGVDEPPTFIPVGGAQASPGRPLRSAKLDVHGGLPFLDSETIENGERVIRSSWPIPFVRRESLDATEEAP